MAHLSAMNAKPNSQYQNDNHYQFDTAGALLTTQLPLPRRSGKVRDVYDLGDRLLIVSTDRISAFDYILPSGIPEKGRLLTAMSEFWFNLLDVRHHLISSEVPSDLPSSIDTAPLVGRVMVTEKASVVPFECVVRGYLEGSGLREYNDTGEICGNKLPAGLKQCDRLPSPIFTPATKAEEGHDENVTIGRMIADVGSDLALDLRNRSLSIYAAACQHAESKGILIADTKFEFGMVGDEVVLIDEVLTPDSSRFWAADTYQPGQAQPSFDKQFVREWLSSCGWDKQSDPPMLPAEIIKKTSAKYIDAYQRISGHSFA
ncbi:Phosphoribosylaminoimidazole-succinocarboxamide synthase [Rubripirellula obstinata]|uniref:Phosphoribosylaminoimidazole-succinocarboxamide synthase n=2 Tax=Rubripirellula obstinata TaxID=406547 RepID=A0A5B1CBG8_9BACT|nr:Phosphoribosylaminoimidazole-succinocarboxamide synthase [Rubripirellula obstinata]